VNITLSRAFVPVLVLALVAAGAVRAHGADSTNGAAGAPPASLLDNDEMVQLKRARAQVLTAHPELKAEEEKLKTLHETFTQQNPPPTADQRNAAFAEWKDYQKSMRAEMLKIDPTLKPLFAKLDVSRKHGAPAPFSPAPAK
jgi:hypothetical protein